jgi:hypothetical protein
MAQPVTEAIECDSGRGEDVRCGAAVSQVLGQTRSDHGGQGGHRPRWRHVEGLSAINCYAGVKLAGTAQKTM